MIVELQGNYCPALPSFSNSNYASLLDEILNVGFVQESGSGLSVIGKTKQNSCTEQRALALPYKAAEAMLQ